MLSKEGEFILKTSGSDWLGGAREVGPKDFNIYGGKLDGEGLEKTRTQLKFTWRGKLLLSNAFILGFPEIVSLHHFKETGDHWALTASLTGAVAMISATIAAFGSRSEVLPEEPKVKILSHPKPVNPTNNFYIRL